jgi:hypothetical protein
VLQVLEYGWHEVLGTVQGILLRFVILAAICGVVMWFARSSVVKRKPPGDEPSGLMAEEQSAVG